MSECRSQFEKETLIYYLDKSNNLNLKTLLDNYPSRLFNNSACLTKCVRLNHGDGQNSLILILSGDANTMKNILADLFDENLKVLIFCSNFCRKSYEFLMEKTFSNGQVKGLFTDLIDLKYSVDKVLKNEEIERKLFRFAQDDILEYFRYEFLKEIGIKIADPTSSPIKIKALNRRLEFDPFISLFTERRSIVKFLKKKIDENSRFHGTTIKNLDFQRLRSKIGEFIYFRCFLQLESNQSLNVAQRFALSVSSRRPDEVPIVFEFRNAKKFLFRIVSISENEQENKTIVVRLDGTDSFDESLNAFFHAKRTSFYSLSWQQPEILFPLILIEMNLVNKAEIYLFDLLRNFYPQLDEVLDSNRTFWKEQALFYQVIDRIARKLTLIKQFNDQNRFSAEFDRETISSNEDRLTNNDEAQRNSSSTSNQIFISNKDLAKDQQKNLTHCCILL